MHPDSDEHQGDDFIALSRALKLIHRGSEFALETLGVYPLSQQFIFRPKRVRAEPFRWAWQRIWGTEFPGEWEDTLSFYEAGQYIVRRDFVHVHPLPFWERLRTDTKLNDGRFSGDIEAMWHVVFNQPVDMVWRESEHTLPLCLRVGVPVSFYEDVV
ncbi:hypothetical protein FOZ60_015452 [Perkinsus olseni]|uniref:Uncharacterized protein n=1 Tax=Perkinsus olseni TaxID=32597 RepID=A0A7J6P5J7_PEROL|nr:hypothetical protein FOZ60_015452 [Perkinsus olseni]